MKNLAYIILSLWTVCWLTAPSFSQTAEKYKAEIEETRAILQQQRITVIKRAMSLTPSEQEKFWPLYERYQADIQKLGDREVKLITLYADHFENLTDKVADQIVEEHFAIVKAKNELKMKYYPEFKNILPVIKAARFFQIENKIDALNANDLARKVPLFEAPK